MVLSSFLFGVLGGLMRTSLIFLELYRTKKLNNVGLIIVGLTLLASGGLGGIIFDINWIFSILGGYAALDILNSISKSFKKTKIKIS